MKTHLRIRERYRIAIKADGTQIPVIDSKFSTLIQPNEEDIKHGIPGDHANCMYCVAVRRMYQSELVWVARGVSYVELRGKNGKPELHRFILTSPAQTNIKKFDAGENLTPEAVLFAAPEGCQRLDAIRKRRMRQEGKRQKAIAKGKAYVKGKARGNYHKPRLMSETLRSPATGKFQFHSLIKS